MKQNLNKKIYIVDCDYLYGTSVIPNYKAMKLYSYYDQLGHRVMLIRHEYELTNTHDMLFLIRELRHTPFPPGDLLDDRRTILIGKEFEIFDDVQTISDEVAVCRPDYSIYQYEKPNRLTHYSFVQFYNNNKKLKNVQDWHKANSKGTVVVDENFWDFPDAAVLECLEKLRSEHSIVFLSPIKLKKLLNEEILNALLKLKLAKAIKIVYNNNIGEDYSSAVKAIDLIAKLRKRYSYIQFSPINFKIITKDHWASSDNRLYDFERCLKIMVYSQKKRIRINFKYPKMRLASPAWTYFEFFKTWSNHHHLLCYIEALTLRSRQHYDTGYAAILNNSLRWNTSKTKMAVYLLAKLPDLMMEYGFVGWNGMISSSRDQIDFNYVKEKAIEDHIL